jgi:hypothetical protein
MDPVPDTARFSYDPSCAWRNIEGRVAIISSTAQRIRVLNEVASRVWELCSGHTFAEVVDLIVREFDVTTNDARTDIAELLNELCGKGMLKRVEGT